MARLCIAVDIYATRRRAGPPKDGFLVTWRVQRGPAKPRLGENAPLLDRLRHAFDGDDERRLAVRRVVGLRLREHRLHRTAHVDLQAPLDLVELPVELGAAL